MQMPYKVTTPSSDLMKLRPAIANRHQAPGRSVLNEMIVVSLMWNRNGQSASRLWYLPGVDTCSISAAVRL